ncbi:hypothetical protein G6F43_005724 [Rhizopus delemar]|nr:hypothetical protein G6F43_005724 [Rhizopus delemar]
MVSNAQVTFVKIPTALLEADEHINIQAFEIDLNADIPGKFKVDELVNGILPFEQYTIKLEQCISYLEARNEDKTSGLSLSNYTNKLGMLNLTAVIGFDAAFNYKANDPAEVLPKLCPNDFVIYFDNVCCKALESVSKNTNPFSRSVCCDMMSKGNCEKPEPVHTLFRIIAKDFEACGFIYHESIAESIQMLPQTLVGRYKDINFGKQIEKMVDL